MRGGPGTARLTPRHLQQPRIMRQRDVRLIDEHHQNTRHRNGERRHTQAQ